VSRPRTIDDETLLPKAVRLFWRKGFAETGLRELEQVLGLKAPSIYNRFGSKDLLFQAVLAHYIDSVVCLRIKQHLEAGDPMRGLRAFFDTTYDYLSAEKPARGCLLVNTSLESSAHAPASRAQLKRGSGLIRGAFRRSLARAQAHGQLSSTANVGALADALHLGLEGLLVTSKVEQDKAVLNKRTDALFALLPIVPARARSKR
jgi:TetR/AcrR family transcriptional repressor of nem operon